MVDNRSHRIDRIFHALSDSTRRGILAQLASQERTVSELAEPYDQTLAGISKHLIVLENAALIKKKRSGRITTCSANFETLGEICEVLEQLGGFWRERLGALEKLLTDTQQQTEKSNDKRESAAESRRTKGNKRRP